MCSGRVVRVVLGLFLILLLMGCGRSSPVVDPETGEKGKEGGEKEKPPVEPKVPPNTLTPQELAVGTILLFDGKTTFGWHIDGDAKVEEGVLKIGGKKPATARTKSRFAQAQLEVGTSWTGKAGPLLTDRGGLTLTLSDSTKDGKFYNQSWTVGGGTSMFTEKDGTRVMSYGGVYPLTPQIGADSQLWLRDVKIAFRRPTGRPLKRQTIEKWTSLPGGKVKLGTADGWTVLEGGPGGVRSEPRFASFAMQMECKLGGEQVEAAIGARDPEKGIRVKLRVADSKVDVGEVTGVTATHRTPTGLERDKPFYLTLIVCENDVAVWVNGVQVADGSAGPPEKGQTFRREPITLRLLSDKGSLSVRNVFFSKLLTERVPPAKGD